MIRLFKRKQKLTTVKNLLDSDNVSEVLIDVNKIKTNIKHVLVIYVTNDDKISWESTNGITKEMAVYILEQAKIDWLSGNIKDAEDDDD